MGRQERLREQARARNRRVQERIASGKVKPPSNAEALREIGDGMRASGQDNEALLADLRANPMRAQEHLVDGFEASGETPVDGPETEAEFYARVEADPELQKLLTPTQLMSWGMYKQDRKLEREVAEADANE